MKTLSMMAKSKRILNSRRILSTIGDGVKVMTFLKKQVIFSQGDADTAVFYIQQGKVRLTVTSRFGKEATLGILGKGEFFGGGGLAGQPIRMKSASAMTDCELLQVDKSAMMLALHRKRNLSDLFMMRLLARNIRYQEALVDQLFDPCDVRLAQVLLMHAHFGQKGTPETVIPTVSEETLAKMAGTSRLRVCSLMKKFRKAGFLAYSNGGLQIHRSLLSVVLRG